jgi:hypothetical protein
MASPSWPRAAELVSGNDDDDDDDDEAVVTLTVVRLLPAESLRLPFEVLRDNLGFFFTGSAMLVLVLVLVLALSCGVCTSWPGDLFGSGRARARVCVCVCVCVCVRARARARGMIGGGHAWHVRCCEVASTSGMSAGVCCVWADTSTRQHQCITAQIPTVHTHS